jgi:ureidoglycolate hydrolase
MSKSMLSAVDLNSCSFERFGTAILPIEDMTPHSEKDAILKFDDQDLRYYIMRLRRRPAKVSSMTRHQRATQCLGSADAQPWWMVVAEPGLAGQQLNEETTCLIRVEAGEAMKLHQGTWHAGPFFLAPSALFFNLELSDTNLTDHNSHSLPTPIQLHLT